MKKRLLLLLNVSTHSSIVLLLLLKILFRSAASFTFQSVNDLSKLGESKQRQKRFQSSARGRETLATSSWSKAVEFDTPSSSYSLIDTKNIAPSRKGLTSDGKLESYNLVSPREWLEYCEARQRETTRDGSSRSNREENECDGAYTVLRCDFLLEQESWRLWGKDFHFHRLKESFRLLLCRAGLDKGEHQDINSSKSKNEKLALDSSCEVMNLLLEEAKATIFTTMSEEKRGKSKKITVMLTLLWDLDHTNDDDISIRVRGHAFSTMEVSHLYNSCSDGDQIVAIRNPNTPVQAVIGHLPVAVLEKHEAYKKSGSASLPNRYQNFPRGKLSSWCRRRRILEDVFKTTDIGDVLLTKPCDHIDDENHQSANSFSSEPSIAKATSSSLELLEGLTSNLFVVYPGKILRTALSEYVLGGYVRQLIIECAESCGYTVEFGSISVEDASLWEEVFVTSSIRLIIPVERVFRFVEKKVDDEEELFQREALWELSSDEERKCGCSSVPRASDLFYAALTKQKALD